MVVPAGMDSHSFEPTPADMITMQQADLMVCNGGEMEQWVEKSSSFPGYGEHESPYDDGLCRCTGREIVEGMEDNEHSHDDHGHAHENEEEDHDHSEMDHIVLTMR